MFFFPSSSSGEKVFYKGRWWDENDPLKPPGLTDMLIKRDVARSMAAQDQTPLSIPWKIVCLAAEGLKTLGIVYLAVVQISGSIDTLNTKISSALSFSVNTVSGIFNSMFSETHL